MIISLIEKWFVFYGNSITNITESYHVVRSEVHKFNFYEIWFIKKKRI